MDDGDGGGLVIRLFGEFDARVGHEVIPAMASTRLQSLLGFLIVGRDRPVTRQRLAFLFWPDSSEKQARTNVRQALHHLRRALGRCQHHLRVDHHTVQWIDEAGADVDLARFERWAADGLRRADGASLMRAADLYGGDLLQGCYDDWVGIERQRLRAVAAAVLDALVSAASACGDTGSAIATAERLRQLDPLDESTYRRLIELHVTAGDRVRAMRTYHECVAMLDRELGVAPDRSTVAPYEAVMSRSGERGRASGEGAVPPSRTAERLPLIGRDTESSRLDAAWRATVDGPSRAVLVTGEPGIGKSRLVEVFRDRWARDGVPTAAARAYEVRGAVPYGPVIELLRADAVRTSLTRLDPMAVRRLARVMPELTPVEPEPGEPPPDAARHELFSAIAAALLVPGRALLIVLDDLHWCDEDTLDLVEFVLRAAVTSPASLLLVSTAREEEVASRPRLQTFLRRLHAIDVLTELPLDRLGASDSGCLASLALGEATTDAAVAEVVEAAEGHPLFLVEMARSGLVGRRSTVVGAPARLPPRVQAVIEARLDQLSPAAADVSSVCAVVGRACTVDVVGRLVPDEHDAVTGLDELWRRGILREGRVDSYDFTHDKIREVAYARIGPARRRRLHAAVARALRDGAAGTEPAQIADHFERAGDVSAALDAHRLAVAGAAHVFAHQDVIACCRRALRLIAARPPGPERDDAELDFLVPLGVAILAGPGIAEADIAVYERARVLRGQRGLIPDPSTLRLSANAAISRRDYHEARRFGEILLECGRHDDDDILVTEGCYLIGVTSFWLGELERSRGNLEAALSSNRPEHTPIHLERFAQDPRAVCLTRLALTRHHLGDPSATDLLARALAVAADTGHVYTDVYVRTFAAWLLADSGRAGDGLALVDGMATDEVTNLLDPIARSLFGGWARAAAGDLGSAIPLLEDARDRAHHDSMLMFEPLALLTLADAHSAAGRPGAALEAVVAACDIASAEMPFHLPEAWRRRGELLLDDVGNLDEARADLGRAAELAARQGNVVAELRARTTLLRSVTENSHGHEHAVELRRLCARLPGSHSLRERVAAGDELARFDERHL